MNLAAHDESASAHHRRRALTDSRRSPIASETIDDQAVREGRSPREIKRRPRALATARLKVEARPSPIRLIESLARIPVIAD